MEKTTRNIYERSLDVMRKAYERQQDQMQELQNKMRKTRVSGLKGLQKMGEALLDELGQSGVKEKKKEENRFHDDLDQTSKYFGRKHGKEGLLIMDKTTPRSARP
jgi:ribosome-interacting GTPase 1